MLEAGFEIERYVVEGVLGEGGMAVVYMVRHRTLGTRHALKVLSVTNKQVRERLIQEGQVQATLRHPNIVGVTDVIDVEGAPGLLMEYIEGAGLDHWLDYYQPTLAEALTVFKAIVAGVGHAHERNLIHRDLKPGNVMLHVTATGVVPKVTDFGLAKATDNNDMRRTRTGTTMGTPAYMAPEQIRDASSVDRRADLYSLGCILYELVCHRTPYVDEDMLELFTAIRSGNYPDPRSITPDLPDAVVATIRALITVTPEQRLVDCAAILEILEGDGLAETSISGGSVEALGPPRPVPPMMITTLPPTGAAAAAARSMVREVSQVRTGPVDDASWAGKVASPSRASHSPVSVPAPTSSVSIEAPAKRGRTLGVLALLGVGGVLFLLVVVVVLLIAVLANPDSPETVVVEVPVPAPVPTPPVPTPPVPTAPEPVQPTPVPEPVPVEPHPTPAPVPVPPRPAVPVPARPEPAPSPVPVAPVPVAPVPTPAPAPTPTPMAATGKFAVTTDGPMAVTIQAESGPVYKPDASVPPGSYEILINGRRGAGTVVVREGRTSQLQCYAAAARCKVL